MASNQKKPLIAEAALAADKTGTSVALGSRSKSFIGWIKAANVHAATTITAKIQHSPDGTNWKDVVSFTNIVGAASTEEKQITANVFGQVRGLVTLAGATKLADVYVDIWFDDDR